MARTAVSITIAEENLLWLKGRAGHRGGNLSAVVDQLIADARAGHVGSSMPVRSVVGTIEVAADDPELKGADDMIRDLFVSSVSRPFLARASSPKYRVGVKPRKTKPGRG